MTTQGTARDNKKTGIVPRHIQLAVRNDEELTATPHQAVKLLALYLLRTNNKALEDYLLVLLGLVKDGSPLQHKVQFMWINQEDELEDMTMYSAWYEVLSVLHLKGALSLSQANLLLLPRMSTDGYLPKVSEESRRSSIDILLKAAGYLDCAVRHILPQLPVELRRDLPVDLAEGVLRALCLQALGQISGMEHLKSPFQRIVNDVRGRTLCYKQDWKSEISSRVWILAPTTYIFFAFALPVIAFGEQLSRDTVTLIKYSDDFVISKFKFVVVLFCL